MSEKSDLEKLKGIFFMSFNLYKKSSKSSSKLIHEIIKTPHNGIRLHSLLRLIVNILPEEVIKSLAKKDFDFSRLPINPDEFKISDEVFNYGFQQALFLLESKNFGLKILKIDFYQGLLNKSTEEVRKNAILHNDRQKKIQENFGLIPGILVPTTYYFTAESPFDKKETQMCLTDCVKSDTEFIDLYNLNNLTEKLIYEKILKSREFRETMKVFCKKIRSLCGVGFFMDLGGQENLVIASIKGKDTICFLDCQNELALKFHDRYLLWLGKLENILESTNLKTN